MVFIELVFSHRRPVRRRDQPNLQKEIQKLSSNLMARANTHSAGAKYPH